MYRFADNATGSSAARFGNYILKNGAGEIRRPTWNNTETVIRILPQWNFAENRWEPYRRSCDPMDYGDWIRRYEAVKGFGPSGITMLLYDPITNPNYDIQQNPCMILYKAINAAIDAGQCQPDWPALLKGGQGRRALLSRPQPLYLVRAAIFRINDKDMDEGDRSPLGLAESDPPFFMELARSAGEKLVSMLERRNEGFSGDPDDYDAFYYYGDVVSLEKGAFIHIYEDGATPKSKNVAHTAAPKTISVSSGARGFDNKKTFKGYDIQIEKTFKGYSASLDTPELTKVVRDKQRPWEDSIQFLSSQEQAFLIQDGFPPSAILYAWRDHPDWIKEETRNKAVNRVSATAYTSPSAPVIPNAVPSVKPETSPPVGKVGGWGNKAWGPEGGLENQDTPNATVTVDTNESSREAKAKAALEAAKARLVARTSDTN